MRTGMGSKKMPQSSAQSSGRSLYPMKESTQKPKNRKDRDASECKKDEIPRINGVPATLTPLLISAIKKLSKHLRNAPSLSKLTEDHPKRQHTSPLQSRIHEKIRNKDDDDPISLIQNSTRDFISQLRTFSTSEVPAACLSFLLGIIENPDRKPHLRRGALVLAKELLLRSKSCRIMLGTSTHTKPGSGSQSRIKSFVDGIGSAPVTSSDNNSLVYFQRDVLEMMQELSVQFGELYPHFFVAARFLEERKGVVNMRNGIKPAATSLALPSGELGVGAVVWAEKIWSVAQLRKARDDALRFGDKECEKVKRLVDKANICFETLVPRFGFGVIGERKEESNGLDNLEKIKHLQSEEEDDDDDIDIDWEDGDDGDDDENDVFHKTFDKIGSDGTTQVRQNKEKPASPLDHATKVDRTLAARTGGYTNFSVEVDFDRALDNDDILVQATPGADDNRGNSLLRKTDTNATDNLNGIVADHPSPKISAANILHRCADLLSCRHLPLLRFWIESLVSADNLTSAPDAQSENVNQATTHASSRKMRRDMVRKLMDLKIQVASTLASASKLSVVLGENKSANCESVVQKITNDKSKHLHVKQSATIKQPKRPESGGFSRPTKRFHLSIKKYSI